MMRQVVRDPESSPLVDQYFMGSLKKLYADLKYMLNFRAIRALAVAIVLLLNIYVLNPPAAEAYTSFTQLFKIFLAHNCAEFLLFLSFYHKVFKNKNKVLSVAAKFKHSMSLQDLRDSLDQEMESEMMFFEVEPTWGLRVSSRLYDFENMEKPTDVPQEFKTIRENIGNNNIMTNLQKPLRCFRLIAFLLVMISTCILLYGATLSYQLNLPEPHQTFLQLYILSEIILKPKLFMVLLIICIIPVLCIFFCLYFIFCRKSVKIELPSPTEMTTQMLSQCNQCSICFMNYNEGQKVIVLKCSDLHIFHETCITGWSKVKANCPICRHDLQ